ncbi:MAG: nitroreductase family protein [Candidatus Lokiarchaeota archaeon]|nr:nitroreductase family protein [Candidatus Lokiarchaeota archaeon]
MCGLCKKDCPGRLFSEVIPGKMEFNNPEDRCILCGHCIAVCPEEAILYQEFEDNTFTFDKLNSLPDLVSYDNLYKFVRAHRSIRHYKREPIPPETLKKVIDVMQYAPTGRNMRSERYTIVSSPEKIKELSEAVYETLAKDPMYGTLIVESYKAKKEIYDAPILFDAPHAIIVTSTIDLPLERYNIGILITYGRLAAQSLGLGTCWSGYTQMAAKMDNKILQIAGTRGAICGVFTIGYPAIKYQRCPPRPHRKVNGF